MNYFYTDGTRLSISYDQVVQENRNIFFPVVDIPNASGYKRHEKFPDVDGYIKYRETEKPQKNITEYYVEIEPEFDGQEYVQVWSVMPLSSEEQIALFENEKENLKSVLTKKRREREEGGTTVVINQFLSFNVSTDTKSQNKLLGVYVMTIQNPEYTVNWKMSNGSFVTLNATMIVHISTTVRNHIQKCFDREAELLQQINEAQTFEQLNLLKEEVELFEII